MIKDMTISELARTLRNFAEMTAKLSQNWDNMENIFKDTLQQTFNAGKLAQVKEFNEINPNSTPNT